MILPNRIKNLLRVFAVCLLIVASRSSFAQDADISSRLLRLKTELEKVLRDTNTPALGVAIVTRDSSLWVSGLGKANIAGNIRANAQSMFRIASITKMFVALSILKLQEEGKLKLNDRIRDLAPDVAFENRWEQECPVRIVHLLEHTTGWDDYHLVEQTPVPLTLKEGLDFHPHSRRSRWIPGSRMAYSNSGSAVAAYIVEKITGQRYEDYVGETFFRPLQMTHSTFHNDERYAKFGVTLYNQLLEPLPYRHVIQRPAGSISSSASDMGEFVRFFLNQGSADTIRLLSDESIKRMEASETTPGARAGLQVGYGLANFTSVHKGLVFQGHNGALPGALSELAYLPQHGIGHAFFINTSNGFAYSEISRLIRDFEADITSVMSLPFNSPSSVDFTFNDGYYFPINPRFQWGYFMDRIIDIHRFEKRDSVLVQSWLLPGAKHIYYPMSDSQFRGPQSSRITLVRAQDPLAGDVLYTDSRVYKPVSAFLVFAQLAIILLWIAMMMVGTGLWVFSLASYRFGRSANALRLTSYPMMTTIMFSVLIAAMLYLPGKHNELLIAPGLISIALMGGSVWLALSALMSVLRIFTLRKIPVAKSVFSCTGLLACLHLLVTAYLLWFDIIPIVTWY